MSPIIIIYVATAVVGIAVAALLVHLARLSGQARLETARRLAKQAYLESDTVSDESLRKVLFEEVKEVVNSEHHAKEISGKVDEIVSKELEKRIKLNAQELAKKYDTTIKEKAVNEEMAWKKYKKVLTEKKNTEAVIRSIAEGLVVVDAKGKVIMMNPAAEKILGASSKDKVGKSISDNVKQEQLISMVKTADDEEKKEIELVSQQDETRKIIRASSAVIENENGQTIGMVSVLSDITKQKELDLMKSLFVASVSHELRTPLVAIGQSISLILSKATGPLSENQEQFLTIASRNLKRLGRLIDELLDLSKLESGKMPLKPQNYSIAKIIEESTESLATWASTKSVKIQENIHASLPEISLDHDRIVQVMTNLIGNAIKFTPANGTITVEALLSPSGREVQVSVADTGIGI
ncbi:MAG: histidine kinase dimerization/phospho-acceptor domain-containing protein, partial [Deltaproteobacteria bacterium]